MSEETAFDLDDEERYAWVVILRELDGMRFDWSTQEWVNQNG